jgi:PIN domain nuclease of toxin-antitoxin system
VAEVVLDASALLALLNSEPGADLVAAALSGATISAVNLSEVVAKLAEAEMAEEAIREAVQGLPMEVVSFDREQAYEAGLLRPSAEGLRPLTRGAGLSLGDRACLALARRLALPALTADRRWEGLGVGVAVQVIR